MEILSVRGFGRGHKVRRFLWSSWNLWCGCFQETCFSATSFAGPRGPQSAARVTLLRKVAASRKSFFSSLSLSTHLQTCEKTAAATLIIISRIIQSAGSRDGEPGCVIVWFSPTGNFRLRPSKLPPRCCGVMTVIIARYVRRCKMTNVSIRANNAYRALQGYPYAVTIEQRRWLIQGRVIAHTRAGSILTALMGNALVFSGGPLKVTKHVVLRLNIY